MWEEGLLCRPSQRGISSLLPSVLLRQERLDFALFLPPVGPRGIHRLLSRPSQRRETLKRMSPYNIRTFFNSLASPQRDRQIAVSLPGRRAGFNGSRMGERRGGRKKPQNVCLRTTFAHFSIHLLSREEGGSRCLVPPGAVFRLKGPLGRKEEKEQDPVGGRTGIS